MEENKIDINSLIGFFLIGLIFIGWLWLNPPPPVEENTNIENSTIEASVNESSNEELADVLTQTIAENNNEEELNLSTLTSLSDDKKIKLETEKFSIEFSSIGGQISSLRLKEHLNYLGKPVNLIESPVSL